MRRLLIVPVVLFIEVVVRAIGAWDRITMDHEVWTDD